MAALREGMLGGWAVGVCWPEGWEESSIIKANIPNTAGLTS